MLEKQVHRFFGKFDFVTSQKSEQLLDIEILDIEIVLVLEIS